MATSTSAILTLIGDLVTSSVTWMTTIVGFVTSTPLVLIFVLFGFVGIGISLLRRFV